MIGNLVERLRVPCATADSKEAADEIERLRALNAELVAALEPFAVENKVYWKVFRAIIAKAKGEA